MPVKSAEKTGHLELASRLQQCIIAIMRYVVHNVLIDHNPAYDLAGAIATARSVHRPALPLECIAEFMERIEAYKGKGLTRLAVSLCLLTFIRSSELRFARWSEIDFKNALWTFPEEREPLKNVKLSHRGSKMKSPHLVPLSKQALAILKEIETINGDHDLVFTGFSYADKPISENTINKALRAMGYGTQKTFAVMNSAQWRVAL